MKKLILSSLALIAALCVNAKQLTPEEALGRLATSGVRQAPALNATPRLMHTFKSTSGTPAVYLFDKGSKGYMFLSADDTALPVLGYSDSGTIDINNMPPQLQWWLEQYAEQIEYAAANGMQSAAEPMAVSDEVIAPMLKTTWNQTTPYNNLCPLSAGRRTMTGCLATAVAQVMKYWNYPECGRGKISYTSRNLGKMLSLDFSKQSFDWENMLPNYNGNHTAEQDTAVAYLMKAVGYACKMSYGTESSGAYSIDIAPALQEYFDYDAGMTYVTRSGYSSSDWQQLIFDNLKNVGPIPYGGTSELGGGHQFVCDGYDGKGYFHFNWGWDGMSDGFYSLDALNPGQLGIGGGSGGGYNFKQDAVLGVQPNKGTVVEKKLAISQFGSIEGEIDNSYLTMSLYGDNPARWSNDNSETVSFRFGVIAQSLDDASASPKTYEISASDITLRSGYYSSQTKLRFNLRWLDLADGKHKVTLATRFKDTDEWVPVNTQYGNYNYVIVTRQGDQYSVSSYEQANLRLESGELLSELYYNSPIKVSATITNPFDIEYTGGFAPVFFLKGQTQLCFQGESIFLTLQPGETVTREWVTSLAQFKQGAFGISDVDLVFSFYNEQNGVYYTDVFAKDVVLKPTPDAPHLEAATSPEIINAQIEREFYLGAYRDVYQVEDKNDIEVAVDYQLVSGVLANWLFFCVYQEIKSEPGAFEGMVFVGNPVFETEEYAMNTFEQKFSIPGATKNTMFLLNFAYERNNKLTDIGESTLFRIVDKSGVESVAVEPTDAPAEFFNLQGVKVSDNAEGLTPGIYIRRQGSTATKVQIR